MLDFMRKSASGWFAKVLLGGIALIFALYFGFSRGGPPAGGTAPIAKVNGENIPTARLNQVVQRQLNALGGQQGQDFRKMLEVNLLQQMIRSTLMAQEANDLGLRITDQALANAIRSNPNFQQDGVFNEEFYLKQFKPYFERTNGENYEYALEQEMLAQRLQGALNQAGIVANTQLKDQLTLRDTHLSIEKLKLSAEKPLEELLKDPNLEIEKVENQSIDQLFNSLPNESALAMLTCLLQLKPGEVCKDTFSTPQGKIALRLTSRESQKTDEAIQETLRHQLIQGKRNLILQEVSNELMKQAKIETFLTQ